MTARYIKWTASFLLLLSSGRPPAGAISISRIPVIDQMPSNSVQRVLQDSDGFMWFGTLDGLCRYDCYRLMVFRSDFRAPELLSDNTVTALAEDKSGNILIGTKEGMNILDRKTYTVGRFPCEPLEDQDIKSILVASDSTIWVGGRNSVYRFRHDYTLIREYVHDPGGDSAQYSSLPNNGINSIYEDLQGDIWVLMWNSGLYRFDPATGGFSTFPAVGRQNNPFKLFQDADKDYWICTWGDGIYAFNPNANRQQMYVRQDGISDVENTFFSIVQDDRQGWLWSMGFSGMYVFEKEDSRTLRQVDVSEYTGQTNNIFSEIILDRDGNLWIGAFGEGAFVIDLDDPVVENFPVAISSRVGIASNITVIYEDVDGNIFVNVNRHGFGRYDPRTDMFRLFTEFPGLAGLQELGTTIAIEGYSPDNTLWAGVEGAPAVIVMDRRNGEPVFRERIDLRDLHPNPGLFRLLFEDSRNNMWIASENALFVKHYNEPGVKLATNLVWQATAITEDTRGTIWISTERSGLFQIPYRYNTSLADLEVRNISKGEKGLPSNNIQAVSADREGRVWVGSMEGNVFAYDIRDEEFRDFTRALGLRGGAILGIVTDNLGHVWVSTNKMITEYSPRNSAYVEYSAETDLKVNSFIKGSHFRNPVTGSIYFGGNMGFCRFMPSERLYEPPREYKPIITDVKVGNTSLLSDDGNKKFDINRHILRLDPDDRNIEIDFSSLDYTSSSKVRFAYRMEGVDDDWVYVSNNRQYATYNQLKKGTYNFKVRATDRNNVWGDTVTVLKITKKPAYYESWWAYLLYTLAVLTVLYIATRVIIARVRLRNELRIAQIDREKSEELTQTKLRYFTNISHDFLTPLTIISYLIDDIEVSSGDKRSQYESVRQNVNKLKRLLQQVLDFRKAESGNLKLRISGGEIVTFIEDICYTQCLPLVKKKNIDFSFNAEPASLQAWFDADKVDKVVFNLLSNALKYTQDNGSVAVKLEGFQVDGFQWLRITVSDTGIGIPEEMLTQIFERFYMAHTLNASDSNGIGLSLTKELVELHKGTINVSSEAGKGSVFTVEIPVDDRCFAGEQHVGTAAVVEGDRAATETIAVVEQTDISTVAEKEDITILVVEDNEELLQLISNFLSIRYNVLTAENGHAALEQVANNNVDIVVSDVMMPGMDGLELSRTLKDDIESSHISIILLTAKNSPEDRIECYNAGADGYISKPFELKVLEARINNFISFRRKRQKEFKTNVNINLSALEYPSRDENFLQDAVRIIEENLSEAEFDVNTFADSLNMSKSSLYRKIKTMTGLSPKEFIRNIRLKHACRMLKDNSVTIAEVAYHVGFSDPKYFTTCFKNEFDMTPSEYQRSPGDN